MKFELMGGVSSRFKVSSISCGHSCKIRRNRQWIEPGPVPDPSELAVVLALVSNSPVPVLFGSLLPALVCYVRFDREEDRTICAPK